MDTIHRSPQGVHVSVRAGCALGTVLCIYLAISVNLRHPVQIVMDILAPTSLLLLMFAKSYDSTLAKCAVVASLLLGATMIAAPHLFPSPLRW